MFETILMITYVSIVILGVIGNIMLELEKYKKDKEREQYDRKFQFEIDEEDRKAKMIKVPLKTLENGHIPVLEEVFTDYANKNLHMFTELLRKVDANQSELASISDVHAKIKYKDLANRNIMILECRVNSIDGDSRGFTWWSYAKMQENANDSADDIKAAHKIINELVLEK